MVRPAAEAIQSAQEQADLANYNKRFDSFRQVADSMERLQHRREADLPAVPALEPGGDPDLWRTTPVEVRGPTEVVQVLPKLQGLEANIDREAYEANPPATDWDDL